jgi:hypothetical protein
MGPAAASESRVAAKESRLQAQSGDFPAPDASAAISRPLGPRVIKSVHAVLCAGWLIDGLRPDAVVILSRHPLATLDSWRRLSMPDATRAWRVALRWLEVHGPASVPPSTDAPMVRMALQLGYMRYCLDTATSSAIRCGHEELCESPVGALRSVADQCGLEWTAKADHFLHRSDREGSGYRPARRAADEPGKWRGRYSAAELATVVPVLEAFRPETVRREARACRSEC